MADGEGKRAGRAPGDRGYGPQLQNGAGARLLATYMTALAQKHATFAEQIGRVRLALNGMADAREQFDMARRDVRRQWAPHPVPLADKMRIDQARQRSRDLIDSRAQQASVGLWHLRPPRNCPPGVRDWCGARFNQATLRLRMNLSIRACWIRCRPQRRRRR
jgi:hypothetical protein